VSNSTKINSKAYIKHSERVPRVVYQNIENELAGLSDDNKNFINIAKTPHAWIDEYLCNESLKGVYASYCGIDEDTWKKCLLALLNGSTPLYREGSIAEYIPDEESRRLFNEVTADFRKEIRAWRKWLRSEYVPHHLMPTKGGMMFFNSVRKGIPVKSDHKKLGAHTLQGFEQKFIDTLICLGSEYHFEVLSHEHDGLITLGVIPEAAIRQTKNLIGAGVYERFELRLDTPVTQESSYLQVPDSFIVHADSLV